MAQAATDDWVTAPAPTPAANDDSGIPTITVRPQGQKPANAGNEGGRSSSLAAESQPQVNDWVTRGSGAAPASGFSVTPPPPDKAPIVEAAAKQYGVPLPVAHFVGSTESHWNDAATGIPTSSGRAQGAWQFMPQTAKEYGLADPTDFNAATPAAMHKLADLAQKNGGDWEKAVEQYGTFSTGQGAAADAAVRQKFRDYMGNQTPVQSQQPSTIGDIARGATRGVTQGVGSILGLPADVWSAVDEGSRWLIAKGLEETGAITPEHSAWLISGGPYGQQSYGPTTENINNTALSGLDRLGVTAPKTTPGRYAQTIGSFLPGAAIMGGTGSMGEIPGARMRYGVIPGATSETAGQLTAGTPAEPYARVAGAIMPQAVGAGYSAAEHALNPVNRSMQGVTPVQASAAQTLLDESRAPNAARITVPEALQQTTGSGTGLGNLQRVVEQSPQGGAIMQPFFAQRPGQTETLARNTLDQIAGVPSDPYQVAPRVQGAADQTVQAANTARTQAVDPHYQAAATDTVPAGEMEGFLQKLDNMIGADKTGLTSAPLVDMRNALTEREAVPATATTPAQPRVPITDIENLDNARKYFRDLPAQPAYVQKALPKFVGSRVTSLAKELGSIMETHSPEFAQGKQLYRDITENTFNPLARSPTGQLAAAEKYPQQAKILFATNPLPGSERAVGQAIRQIAQRDPEAAAQLVRMHLEQTFNEATQNNLPGANQFGGPKFVAVVAGNTQQAKNLEAAVRALQNGDVKWNALRKSMDILQAMGTRHPVGSQTEFNRQINEALRNGSILPEIAATVASPGRWLHVVHDIYQNIAYGRNTANLARVFTEGSVDDLRALARSGSRSVVGQSRLIGALANVASQQPTQAPP